MPTSKTPTPAGVKHAAKNVRTPSARRVEAAIAKAPPALAETLASRRAELLTEMLTASLECVAALRRGLDHAINDGEPPSPRDVQYLATAGAILQDKIKALSGETAGRFGNPHEPAPKLDDRRVTDLIAQFQPPAFG